MTKEQTEYLLALMGALVETQTQQAEMLAKIGAALDTLDDRIYDLPYRLRQEGIL